MANFTTIPRAAVRSFAPAPAARREDVFLLIGGGYYLNIGSGKKLVITPGQGSKWSAVIKTR